MIVTIDFETFYDAEYHLGPGSKISTSEYVRDSRFEALCASIKIGDAKPKVYWGDKEIRKALKKVKWDRCDLLAHHTHFEGLILSHHFGVIPRAYRDTLSMGRALYPKAERNDLGTLTARLGVQNKLAMPNFKGKRLVDLTAEDRAAIEEYVNGDVESCSQAYVKMVEQFPSDELDLIDVTVRMFADPVLQLDMKLAKKELEREQVERESAITTSGAMAIVDPLVKEGKLTLPKLKKGEVMTEEKLLSSNKVFPELLRAVGIEPPMKVSKTTGKPAYALAKGDEEFSDLVLHPDTKVAKLVRGRLAAKSTIGETRAARLIRSGSRKQNLPVYLNYYGAHTGRWSGGDKLNYQNLKKKGEIRKALLAPKGYDLVVIDSAQIEARVVAWLAGEEWILQAFRDKRDLYCEFATTAYGRVITKADKLERFVGKTCMLGLGFQMGGPKLQKSLIMASIQAGMEPVRLELETCYRLVNTYRSKNRNIEALWNFMNDEVVYDLCFAPESAPPKKYKSITFGREYIGLPNGLRLLYPDARAGIRKSNAGGLGRTVKTRISDASYKTIEGRSKIYGGLITENVVQALARIIVSKQMLEISKKYRVVMMTHDEVVFLAPSKQAKQALAWGLEVMHKAPSWCPDLPVAAEGEHDRCYSK